MADDFALHSSGLDSPARGAAAITPSDVTDLPVATRGIYVGVAGDLRVTMVSGETVTFVGVAAGSILPIRVVRVLASSTTAGSLVGLS